MKKKGLLIFLILIFSLLSGCIQETNITPEDKIENTLKKIYQPSYLPSKLKIKKEQNISEDEYDFYSASWGNEYYDISTYIYYFNSSAISIIETSNFEEELKILGEIEGIKKLVKRIYKWEPPKEESEIIIQKYPEYEYYGETENSCLSFRLVGQYGGCPIDAVLNNDLSGCKGNGTFVSYYIYTENIEKSCEDLKP